MGLLHREPFVYSVLNNRSPVPAKGVTWKKSRFDKSLPKLRTSSTVTVTLKNLRQRYTNASSAQVPFPVVRSLSLSGDDYEVRTLGSLYSSLLWVEDPNSALLHRTVCPS